MAEVYHALGFNMHQPLGNLLDLHNSEERWEAKQTFDQRHTELNNSEEIHQLAINGYDHLLSAETSCHFYWGSAWVHKAFNRLEKAYECFDAAMARM